MKNYRKAKKPKKKFAGILKSFGFLLILFGLGFLLIEVQHFLKTNALFQIENISFEKDSPRSTGNHGCKSRPCAQGRDKPVEEWEVFSKDNNFEATALKPWSGVHLFNHPEVQKILASNYNLNFFGSSPGRLKRQLEKIPQVKSVLVKRRLPNILQIKIIEREPILLLCFRESFYGVDKDGIIFPQLKESSRWSLPVITGLDEKELEVSLRKEEILPEIKLAIEINRSFQKNKENHSFKLSGIHFAEFDEILLYTYNPRLELHLLEGNFEQGLKNLNLVLADLEKRVLLADSLDLRFPEKVFVHLMIIAKPMDYPQMIAR